MNYLEFHINDKVYSIDDIPKIHCNPSDKVVVYYCGRKKTKIITNIFQKMFGGKK